MTFIAGAYTVTYGGNVLGQIEDGIETEFTMQSEDIRGDNLGDTIEDGVYRGGDCFVNFTLTEFNATAAQAAFWPWHAIWGKYGLVGRLLSGMSSTLILTVVAGTTAVPAALTFPYAILAKGFPLRLLFAPRNRRVPLRMHALPSTYLGTGNIGASYAFLTS